MAWLLGALVLFVFIALMVGSPGFRNVVLLIFAIGAAVGFFYWQKAERDEERSYSLISASDLALSEMRLRSTGYSREITGRIKNNSPHDLRSITLNVQLHDCTTGASGDRNCETVGQDEIYLYTNIPAGQVRGFETYVSFHNAPEPKGKTEWDYRIINIRARLPD